MKSPTVLWVISGHILSFFLKKDSEIGSDGIPSNQSDWYGIEVFLLVGYNFPRCLAGAALPATGSRRRSTRSTARWGQAGGKEGRGEPWAEIGIPERLRLKILIF